MNRPSWIKCIRDLLRDGYGVEDIALRLENTTADQVREVVRAMRASGSLAKIYEGQRDEQTHLQP